jgi:hypothetical protein
MALVGEKSPTEMQTSAQRVQRLTTNDEINHGVAYVELQRRAGGMRDGYGGAVKDLWRGRHTHKSLLLMSTSIMLAHLPLQHAPAASRCRSLRMARCLLSGMLAVPHARLLLAPSCTALGSSCGVVFAVRGHATDALCMVRRCACDVATLSEAASTS